jgi:hypothetical protein
MNPVHNAPVGPSLPVPPPPPVLAPNLLAACSLSIKGGQHGGPALDSVCWPPVPCPYKKNRPHLSIKGGQHGGSALDSVCLSVCVGSYWKNFPGTAHTDRQTDIVAFIYKIVFLPYNFVFTILE